MEQKETKKTSKGCRKWTLIVKKGNKWEIVIFLLLLIIGCKNGKHSRRDFFPKMKTSYADMIIKKNLFFIKSFGLSGHSYEIGKHEYWKLTCDKGYFYLSGYLRRENDSIMFVPEDYESTNGRIPEYKLFDFGEPINSSWKIYYNKNGNIILGDSIAYKGRDIIGNDTSYRFSMVDFLIHEKFIEFDRGLNWK